MTRAGSPTSGPPLRAARSRGAHPDGQGAVLAAHRTAAVGAARLRGAPILLFLLEDFRVEFLKPNNKSEND